MTYASHRTVLITGGSSGLGFEMAKQMVAQQSLVIICGRSQDKLDEAKKQVPELVTIQCDITKKEDRARLHDEILTQFKGLNMLVNNAGYAERYLLAKTGDLEERLVNEWRTNFLAPVLLTQLFLPILSKNNGTLVNITSGLAHVPLSVEPSYCASKAALHSMTQSMRIQFEDKGVKVVEIFYPAVDTPFQKGHAPDNAMQADKAAALALAGLDGKKDEVHVGMARFLYGMSRLMPGRALKILNGFIPENAEEVLAEA